MHCSKLALADGGIGVADYLWLVRGNTILNSVKSPGSVSRLIANSYAVQFAGCASGNFHLPFRISARGR
jgi:hypothetical protein